LALKRAAAAAAAAAMAGVGYARGDQAAAAQVMLVC
jgi:hypothetical protein